MKTIITLNPNEEKKKKNKKGRKAEQPQKGKKTMAQKKAKKETKKKKGRKRNPTKGFGGLASRVLTPKAIGIAATGALKQTGGMLLTQFFAKKFAEGGSANDPDWTYKNYLLGTVGAFASGFAAEIVMKGAGQEFLRGGIALILYKIFVNEIAPRNEFLMENFGQDIDAEDRYLPGDTADDETGETWILGQDYHWRPASEDHRTIDAALKQPGTLGALVTPGPLGQDNQRENEQRRPGANGKDPYAAVLTAGGSYPYHNA